MLTALIQEIVCNGDRCPKCKNLGLPKVTDDSRATARACQGCGYVDELNQPERPRFTIMLFE